MHAAENSQAGEAFPLLPSAGWWRRPSLLVAASGGLDSTVLLDLLDRDARRPGGPRLGAAYLDHGWRGEEARLDGDFVEALCRARGLAFFRGREDVPRLARRLGLSLEAAGRRARYAFLAGVARREGYDAVVTAHHAGDQTETLLLRLERGERGDALAGIRPLAQLAGAQVLRPLLDAAPRDLLAYAEARSLPFREDASNRDPRFPRNRLRLAAPAVDRDDSRALTRLAALERRLLERVAQRLEPRLARTAAGLAPAAGGLAAPPGAKAEAGDQEPPGALFPVAELASLDPALRREILRRAHRRASGGVALPRRSLALLERLLGSPGGGRADLPGARAAVSCGWLLVERAPARGPVPRSEGPAAGMGTGRTAEHVELFDPREVRGRLVLRAWRPGDRIAIGPASPAPGGCAAGGKKLKEVFREARVPRWLRQRVPVLADDRGVLWVVGLRRAERARPRPGAPVLRVRIRERTLA